MKKIILLSYHFTPDISAGVFRTQSLVEFLLKSSDYEIHIYTTHPSRFIIKNENETFKKNLKVFRTKLPFIKKNNLFQIINFFFYFIFVLFKSKNYKYDLVFATTSKLATGFLGSIISKLKRINFYLDIRDIFSDTIKSLYPRLNIILRLIEKLEKFTIKSATHVNLVSEGFLDYFNDKYENKNFTFYPNGIDNNFLDIEINNKIDLEKKKIKEILYVGNIGQGQDLHKIIPNLLTKLNNIKITIIGNGNRKKNLVKKINEKKIENCEILEPIARNNLIKYYNRADILFLHLANKKAFEKVLPSKIFEYSVFNKPILAGLNGYCRKFLNNQVEGSYIFDPENAEMAVNRFNEIIYKNYNRKEFIKKYLRKNINANIKKDLDKLLFN